MGYRSFSPNIFSVALFLTFILGFITIPFASANQSPRVNCSNRNVIGKTLQELGARQYKTYLIIAQQSLQSMQVNEAISFPLGLTCPVRLDTNSQRASFRRATELKAIGYLDTTGNVQPITPDDLIKIFYQHVQVLGQASESNRQLANVAMMTDAPIGNGTDDQTLPAVDLIVLDTRDNRPYFVSKVRFSTVLIDALNATLTKNLAKSSYDLKTLNIGKLMQSPITGVQEI